ncbi:MAG: hypothetical protein Q8R25_04985 [bacterium]|nr:hypothetical protein [bacterium]
MGLDLQKQGGNVEPPKSEAMKEREELKALLESKPLTRGVLSLMDNIRNDAHYYGNKVLETPQTKNNIPLAERFFESHEGFVDDLSKIHYALGRLANIQEMLAAARAVEWQALGGTSGHKIFDEAEKILGNSKNTLDGAKEATVRKLDGLMKMGYVHDKIHEDAVVEDEILEIARPNVEGKV